jgi:hypothetical protein
MSDFSWNMLNIPIQYNASFDMVNICSSNISKQYTGCGIINNSYLNLPINMHTRKIP